MRYRQLCDNESSEELHKWALGADTYFVNQVAKNRGIASETLSYLIRKEVFRIPVMARRNQNETERTLNSSERKQLWKIAVENPALSTEDLIWVYEQVSGDMYGSKAQTVSSRRFSFEDIQILKCIGMHRNTPADLIETIKTIRVDGKPILEQRYFEVREYEDYFRDLRTGKPVAPTPPPKPKSPKFLPGSLPRSLPGSERYDYEV